MKIYFHVVYNEGHGELRPEGMWSWGDVTKILNVP